MFKIARNRQPGRHMTARTAAGDIQSQVSSPFFESPMQIAQAYFSSFFARVSTRA